MISEEIRNDRKVHKHFATLIRVSSSFTTDIQATNNEFQTNKNKNLKTL